MSDTSHITARIAEAMAYFAEGQKILNELLSMVVSGNPPVDHRHTAVKRTTSTQILAVMADHAEPLTLIDVADGVIALRRGEDEPKKHGGTRYQEMCRTSLTRMIARGLIERVPPTDGRGMMRFRITNPGF